MAHVPYSENKESGQETLSSVDNPGGRTAVFDRRGEDELEPPAAPSEATSTAVEVDFDNPEFYQNREIT